MSQSSQATDAVSDGDEADSAAGARTSHDHGRRQHKAHHRGARRDGMMIGCSPVHLEPHFSLLSSENIAFSDQSGVATLLFVIVVATNCRLILENSIKYGLRFNPLTFLRAALTPAGNTPLLLCWPALALFSLQALGIERLAAASLRRQQAVSRAARIHPCFHPPPEHLQTRVPKPPHAADMFSCGVQAAEADARDAPHSRSRRRAALRARAAEHLALLLNLANITASLAVPCWVIHATAAEPLPSFALTFAATVVWMKLVSYAHVNWALRRAHRSSRWRPCPGERGSGVEPQQAEHLLVYPENLTPGNLAYFLAAPTLSYQLSYPRTPRVRPRWVLRRLAFLCAALGLQLFIMEQYIEPTIDNSLRPLQEMVSRKGLVFGPCCCGCCGWVWVPRDVPIGASSSDVLGNDIARFHAAQLKP
jgi:diacylglycerol O-acyltransferase-1